MVFALWVVDYNYLNAILIVFYQYFTIISTINKEIMIMIKIIIVIVIIGVQIN